jgi:hypothetical protein
VPPDILVDGEENDAVEALEVLMGALVGHEEMRSFREAQLRRAGLAAWQAVALGDSGDCALTGHSSGNQQRDLDQLAGSAACSAAALSTTSNSPSSGRDNAAAEAAAGDDHEGLVQAWQRVSRVPLEGTLLEEVACMRCRGASLSHVTPCLALPLPLRTAQVATHIVENGTHRYACCCWQQSPECRGPTAASTREA